MRLVSNAAGQTVNLDKAYIQFGPWSFGKFQSFFDFYADAYNNVGAIGSDISVVGAAYSFNFGNGFFATLAIEDRPNVNTVNNVAFPVLAPGFGGVALAPTIGLGANGGYRVPDAVVQFLYDPGAGSWGSAQLSAAVHQARTAYAFSGAFPAIAVNNDIGDTKYGWAVQGGVKFRLDSFSPGSSAYLQAAYTEGALSYVGGGNGFNGLTQNDTSNIISGLSDAYAIGPGGSVKLSKGFNALAAIDYFWTPSFDTAFWVSYTNVDSPNGALTGYTAPVAGYNSAVATARSFDVWQTGVQATWVPVKGLKFAGTVNYFRVQSDRTPQDFVTVGGTTAYVGERESDGVAAALRIQRDF
jgi:hypothetical protein